MYPLNEVKREWKINLIFFFGVFIKCVTTLTYSSGDGWCRTMWIIRPGGYNGLCNVNAIELSLGCVLALRAVYRSCISKERTDRKTEREREIRYRKWKCVGTNTHTHMRAFNIVQFSFNSIIEITSFNKFFLQFVVKVPPKILIHFDQKLFDIPTFSY